MTLTTVIKSNDINTIKNFVADFWQQAENWGRLKDSDTVHATWYKRHRIEVRVLNHKAVSLTIHQGGHWALFSIEGPRYDNIELQWYE